MAAVACRGTGLLPTEEPVKRMAQYLRARRACPPHGLRTALVDVHAAGPAPAQPEAQTAGRVGPLTRCPCLVAAPAQVQTPWDTSGLHCLRPPTLASCLGSRGRTRG